MKDMDAVWREHAQMVYRYLLAQTQDAHLAEELTQETFCEAIRCADQFEGRSRVSTWLCGIAKHLLYTYRRKHPATESLSPALPSPRDPESEVLEGIQYMELMQKLHEQPEPYREVLYLRLLGGMSFRSIGELLGRTENWARVTYYRGKEKIRKELEEHEN